MLILAKLGTVKDNFLGPIDLTVVLKSFLQEDIFLNKAIS
jgi:hypothetical protein